MEKLKHTAISKSLTCPNTSNLRDSLHNDFGKHTPNNRIISMSYRQVSQSHTFINYHIDKSRPVVFWIEASNNEKHYYSIFYSCFIPKNGLYCNENKKLTFRGQPLLL